MTQNGAEEGKQVPGPSRRRIGDFVRASIFTAIPFAALVTLIFAMVGRGAEFMWMGAVALCIVALLTSAGFAIAEKRRAALGILAGTAIGVVGLVISCSTVLQTSA